MKQTYQRIIGIIMGVIIVISAAACTAPQPAQPTAQATPEPTAQPTATPVPEKLEYFIRTSMESAAIADNMVNEKTERDLLIALPASYYESDQSYPVIYFLNGYSMSNGNLVYQRDALLSAMAQEGMQEFIMVEVDGRSKLGGSFYVNSPVIGNWEDFIVEELVTYMDENFRTVPSAAGRGICGFSMGGFGALNIAFKHPDTFSALYTIGAGIVAEDRIADALATWGTSSAVTRSYAAAFAPDVDGEHPYGKIPAFDGSDADHEIVTLWDQGYGDLKGKVAAYQQLNQPLSGIRIEVGTYDSYGWLVEGCRYLDQLLTDEGIDHEFVEFDGTHVIPPTVAQSDLVAFFSAHLGE